MAKALPRNETLKDPNHPLRRGPIIMFLPHILPSGKPMPMPMPQQPTSKESSDDSTEKPENDEPEKRP